MVFCSPPKPMWDITIHLPSGPSVLADTLSFLQSMWDRRQIHPPSGPNVLTDTLPRATPLRRTARKLAHRPVSSYDTICNDPDLPLTDIVLFELSLSGFPSKLENAYTRERFPHRYKRCFVLISSQYRTLHNSCISLLKILKSIQHL